MTGERRPRAYYAAGVPDRDGRSVNREIATLLDELGYEAWLPRDEACVIDDLAAIGMPIDKARNRLFRMNVQAVEDADVVVINLDGCSPDADACVEAGIAYGQGKLCIGYTSELCPGTGHESRMIGGVVDYKIAHGINELRDLIDAQRVIVDLRRGSDEVTIDLRRLERSYVVVSGPLGVGKSSLIDLMSRTGIWTVLPEPVTDNPYLSKVYANLTDYAFRNQAFYLGQRARLHNSAKRVSGARIQERCLSEDAEVFNRVMLDQGAIDDDDFETLMTLYRGLIENAPTPDVLLYLTAPFEVTLERIRHRDRVGESDLDINFLRRVYERYEQWACAPRPVPVLRFDTSEVDYVNRPDDAAATIRRVDRMLTDSLVTV